MSNLGRWSYGHRGEPKEKERLRLLEVALAAKQYAQKRQEKLDEEEALSRQTRQERQRRTAQEGSYWPWGYGPVVSSNGSLTEAERERRREVAAAARHYAAKYLSGKDGATSAAGEGRARKDESLDGAATVKRGSADAALYETRTLAPAAANIEAASEAYDDDTDVEVVSAGCDASAGVRRHAADARAPGSEQRAGALFGRGDHKDQLRAFARFLLAIAVAMEAREQGPPTSAGCSSDDGDAAVGDFLAAAALVAEERTGAQRAGRWLEETLAERQCLWQLLQAIAALQDEERGRAAAFGGRAPSPRDAASSAIADALSAAVAYVAERTPTMYDRGRRLEKAIHWTDEDAWLSDDEDGGDYEESRAGGEVV